MLPISFLVLCATSFLSFIITDITFHESAGLQYLSTFQITGPVTSALHLSSQFLDTLHLPASVSSISSFHIPLSAHSFSTLYPHTPSAPPPSFLSLFTSSPFHLDLLFGSSLKSSDIDHKPGPVCLASDFNATAIYEEYLRASKEQAQVCFLSEAPLFSGTHALILHWFHRSAPIPSTILPPISLIKVGTSRKRHKTRGIRSDTCSGLDYGLQFESQLCSTDVLAETDICTANDSPQLLPLSLFYAHATKVFGKFWHARPVDGVVEERSDYRAFYVVVGLSMVSAIFMVYSTMRATRAKRGLPSVATVDVAPGKLFVISDSSYVSIVDAIGRVGLEDTFADDFAFSFGEISAAAWMDTGSVMEDEYICAITYRYGDGNGSLLSARDSGHAIGDGIAGLASLDEGNMGGLDGDDHSLRKSIVIKEMDAAGDAGSVVVAKEGGDIDNGGSFDLERKAVEVDGEGCKDNFMTSCVVPSDCVVPSARSDTSMLSWTSVYLPSSQSVPSRLHLSDVFTMVCPSSSPAGLDVFVNGGRDADGLAGVGTIIWTSVHLPSSSSSPSLSSFTDYTNFPGSRSSPAGLGTLLDKAESGARISDISNGGECIRSAMGSSWTSMHLLPSSQSLPSLRHFIEADPLPHSVSLPAVLDEFAGADTDAVLQEEEEGRMIYSTESAPADLWSGRIWDLPEPSPLFCSASEPAFLTILEDDSEDLESEVGDSLAGEEDEVLYSGLCSITKTGFRDVFTPKHSRGHSDFTQYISREPDNILSASLSDGSIYARSQALTLWRDSGWWYAGADGRSDRKGGDKDRARFVERRNGSLEDGHGMERLELDTLLDEDQNVDRIASMEIDLSLGIHHGKDNHMAASASTPAHEDSDYCIYGTSEASSSTEVESIIYEDIGSSSESEYDSSGCSESIFSRDSHANSSVTSFNSETSPARAFSLDDEMDITDSPTVKHDLARYVQEQTDKSSLASPDSSSYMTFEELSCADSSKPTSSTTPAIQQATPSHRYPRTIPTAASMCVSSAQLSRVHRLAPVPAPSPWAIFESSPVLCQPTPPPVQSLGATLRDYECSTPTRIVFDEQQDCWELDPRVTGDVAASMRAELHESVLGFGRGGSRMVESNVRATPEPRNEGTPALVSRLKRFWKP